MGIKDILFNTYIATDLRGGITLAGRRVFPGVEAVLKDCIEIETDSLTKGNYKENVIERYKTSEKSEKRKWRSVEERVLRHTYFSLD